MMEYHSRRLGTWVQNTIYIVFGPLKIQRRDVYFCIQGFLAGEGYFDLFPYRVAIALFGSGCPAPRNKNFLSGSTFRSNNWRLRHMSCIWKGGATQKLLLHCFSARNCAECIYILCGRKSTRARDKYRIVFVADVNRRLLCTGEEMIVSWVVEKERVAHLHQVPWKRSNAFPRKQGVQPIRSYMSAPFPCCAHFIKIKTKLAFLLLQELELEKRENEIS